MKKRLLMTIPLLTLLFSSCGGSVPSGEETVAPAESEAEKQIKAIYNLYKANGGELSYEEWLATIKGEKGNPGKDGSTLLSGIGEPSINLGKVGDMYLDTSTYDLYSKNDSGWVKIGNFKGADGEPGQPGDQGEPGEDGKSAYEIAVEHGFVGTEEEWLESLKGEDGQPGEDGEPGKSAYEIAVENGFVGTEEEWLESLKGEDGEDGEPGEDGKSAYEIAVEHGFTGTEEEWLESLKGEDGETPEMPIYVTGVTYEDNIIYVHYSDGHVEEIKMTPSEDPTDPGDDPVDPGDDPGDPGEDPEDPITFPGLYNRNNAYQYDTFAENWTVDGHLYIHYLRPTATKLSIYDGYGVWLWEHYPQDLEGTLWGAKEGKYKSTLHAMSNGRMDDIGGTGFKIDDFGVVYDIDLSKNDIVSGNKGESLSFECAEELGFLMFNLESTKSGGMWTSDGGIESFIELANAWSSSSSKHIYVMEGEVQYFKESAQEFANEYFEEIPEVKVGLSPTSVSLEVGETEQLSVTVKNYDGAYSLSSSNPLVATVSSSGLVTAVGEGSTYITLQAGEKVALCQVTVTEKEPEASLHLYVFIDYNQVEDNDSPYFETMLVEGVSYNLYELGLKDPTSNPESPTAVFVGWSLRPIIFSDDDLIDPTNVSFDGYYVYLYGIWEIQ